MTPLALGLVLVSALCHAGWNYLAKSSQDKVAFSWAFSTVTSVLFLPMVVYYLLTTTLTGEAWLFIAGTMVLHIIYFNLLNSAYTYGDLSVVYPVARGTGLVLAPALAVVALGERVSLQAGLAIAIILAGIFVVHLRGLSSSWIRSVGHILTERGTRFALLTGVTIAIYSVWDKQGVSLSPAPFYTYFVFLSQALFIGPYVLLRRRPQLGLELSERKLAILAAGILSPMAYGLVLTALTFSRVSYIAPAREIGVVIGAALGVLALGEPHGKNRILGAALIVAGVAALALAP